MNNKLQDIKYDAKDELFKAIDNAYKLGQSEDYMQVKADLDEALKHAQEAYEFFKVVMNRFCIPGNNLEGTTKVYLHEIGKQLEKIKGIKK